MFLWIVIGLLTAAAVMAVLAPLGRGIPSAEFGERARRVYRDQLDELERDKAQGRISAAEAEAARAEIARRLIAADAEVAEFSETGGNPTLRRATAVAAILGIPALSFGLYFGLGAPSLPGQPLAARLAAPPSESDLETLLARVEKHLAEAPEDGQGWDVVAPVYARLGRPGDAATAYRNAIRIVGSTEARQTGLGEALLAAQGGIITAEAKSAFAAASAANPAAPAPRFFLALAAEQEGDVDRAAQDLRLLLAEASADAPWRQTVADTLERIEPNAASEGGTEQLAAAETTEGADQAAMIEGMVARLAARLASEPNDVEGWLRLIRSYTVLGRTEEAADAAAAALQGIKEAGDRERVEALLADLGLSASQEPTP